MGFVLARPLLSLFPPNLPRAERMAARISGTIESFHTFEARKMMAKNDEIGVLKWSQKLSKCGKVVSEAPLGSGSEAEWRTFVKNSSFLGWSMSLKHSKYKPKLMFFTFAFI